MTPELKQSWRDHNLLIAVAFVYLLVVSGTALALGAKPAEFAAVTGYFVMTALIAVVFWSVLFAAMLACAVVDSFRRPDVTIGAAFDDRIRPYTSGLALADGFFGLVAVTLLSGFCIGKSLVPAIGHYDWDPLFIRWEIMVHGGRTALDWLRPLLGHETVVRFFDRAYLCWFLVMFTVTAFALFCDRDRARRLRYLWTYVLAWIVAGTGLAILLASVGPVYIADFYPAMDPNPYADTVGMLHTIAAEKPLRALVIADALLDMGRNDAVLDLNAISAMPSLHVAVAWLIVLYARAWRFWPAVVAALLFWGMILVGSVLLGWHYALDGYVSMVLVTFLWWGAGRVMPRGLDAPAVP